MSTPTAAPEQPSTPATDDALIRVQALEQRLASMAKRHRRVWIATCFVTAMVLVQLAGWLRDVEQRLYRDDIVVRSVEASSIVLRDQEFNIRARLQMEKEGVSFRMYNKEGKAQVGMVTFEEGSAVAVFDQKGKAATYMDATKDHTMLGIRDVNEQPRGSWVVKPDGKSSLNLHDIHGQVRANLNLTTPKANLQFVDENGASLLPKP